MITTIFFLSVSFFPLLYIVLCVRVYASHDRENKANSPVTWPERTMIFFRVRELGMTNLFSCSLYIT
jgi:uncharacterized paraquat-inducible protein A